MARDSSLTDSSSATEAGEEDVNTGQTQPPASVRWSAWLGSGVSVVKQRTHKDARHEEKVQAERTSEHSADKEQHSA